jgi:hypothetical protein
MKLKQLVAKTIVAGGLGLPAVGLGIGVANADQPDPPVVPTSPLTTAMTDGNKVVPTTTATPFTSAGTAATLQTGPATAMTNKTAVPTATAAPFGGEAARFANATGLNPRPWVARQMRLIGTLGGLIPLRGLGLVGSV